MPDKDINNRTDKDLALLADEIFDVLTVQFPVCMASDEFHFFPQARAGSVGGSGWDDYSPKAVSAVIELMARWERRLGRYRSPPLTPAAAVDADMLGQVVRTLRQQLSWMRPHETQPTFHLTIVGIGLAEAFETGTEAFHARLAHLPAFLDQAAMSLTHMPRLFRDLGLEMLAKQRTWLASLDVPAHLLAPIDEAMQRLGARLRQAPVEENFLPPVHRYAQIASHHMGCGCDLDDIARELEREIAETEKILVQTAETVAPGRRWPSVVEDLHRPAVPPGGAKEIYRGAISELARHCTVQGITSDRLVAECPVTVEGIPDYMRPVRSNAAYSMPPVHPPKGGTFFILETDREASLPADFRLLTAHETFPGHHLLDTRRWRHPRRVRRHIEFPIFYEGWASFSEELLFDTGFFSGPIDHLLMAKRRFWRAVRGLVDFSIHSRRKTLDEAAAFLADQGMAAGRARAMARRYCLKPGYQLSYTVGRRRFRRLYDDFCRHTADPVDFARRVLAQGEIGFDHLNSVLQQDPDHH